MPARARELLEHVADLLRQFARRHEHQRLEPLVLEVDLFDEGDAERERLARSGECLSDDVFAFEQGGDGERLDLRRRFDFHSLQRLLA